MGVKLGRPNIRVLNREDFTKLDGVQVLLDHLLGPSMDWPGTVRYRPLWARPQFDLSVMATFLTGS